MIQPVAVDKDTLNALTSVLFEYGERHRNPVMDILPGDEPFHMNRKYPEERLKFGHDQWRAYYHSHDVPGAGGNDKEHGHFHIFRRVDDSGDINSDWSHVVALGMDRSGQPLRWFTVNNWVTGDRWLPASELQSRITPQYDAEPLINRWLSTLLGFYQPVITGLLAERDRVLAKHRGRRSGIDVLSDREIYFLSEMPVNLLSDISFALGQ